ncbi:copper resistance CopC family protein [Planomicrobium sp. CPCC 101110]|uniref:copper resistance CopC family protein n=1 Tax=Planomicrobium sp. CPCC 101110 TaxID=2599619 RepID=UPI0011B85BF1|nr:copper resistance CopC family protein [Planomicrobium sp. CPCC 101110]TWT27559.1 copper resistance protein CopC [Planomicrobium sp. CPCC 101110]
MRKILLASIFLILALPFSVQAHTALTASRPAEGEVVKEVLEEVQLTFGTTIEQESTMVLQGEEGTYEFEGIAVSDDSMTGNIAEELPNGAYTVQWKIIGADGHPIEGEIPFAVDIKTTEEPVVENEGTADEEPAVEEEGTSEEEPAMEEQQTSEQAAPVGEEKSSTLVTVLIVAAALLVAAGMFSLFKKRQ